MKLSILILIKILLILNYLCVSIQIYSIPKYFTLKQDEFMRNQQLSHYMTLRCGNNKFKPLYWYYTGSIRNPMTGNIIAGIEGIEFVQRLPDWNENQVKDTFTAIMSKLRLNINQLHELDNNHTTKSSYIPSYMTKKIFIYTNPLNHSNILSSYQIRPQSPKRVINNPYKELNEIISIQSSNIFDNSYKVVIQWPKGRISCTKKMQILSDIKQPKQSHQDQKNDMNINQLSSKYNTDTLEIKNFIHGGKIKLKNHKILKNQFFNILKQSTRWISFSSSSLSDFNGRSQEYYSIYPIKLMNFIKLGQSGMIYHRYGEGPAWYALKHACNTELHGISFQSLDQIPKSTVAMISSVCPHFLNEKLSIDLFDNKMDMLEKYKPWYSRLNPFSWRHS